MTLTRKNDLLVTGFLLLFFVATNLPNLWNNWAQDFGAYYLAGYFFDQGQFDQIYGKQFSILGTGMPELWTLKLAELGHPNKEVYPFIYLPWVAATMAPLARSFDPQQLMNLAAIFNCLSIAASIILSWRIMARQTIPLWVWTLVSTAILSISAVSSLALSLGQIQVFVNLLCLLAFERYRANMFWLAGAALALAACLKITPAVFILIFLWDRNWRAVGGFLAVSSILGLYSLLYLGLPLHFQFLDLLSALSGNLFLSSITLSIEAFLFHIYGIISGALPGQYLAAFTYEKPLWIGAFSKLCFIAGLIVLWVSTHRLDPRLRMPRQLLGLSILVPLTGPYGWVHYYLMALILLPGLLVMVNRTLAFTLLVVIAILLNSTWLLFWIPYSNLFFISVVSVVPYFCGVFLLIALSAPHSKIQPE